MASVLFSTIGQAVGGPLAAAVGAAVGGSVDAVLFGARRRGSGELFVQRSAYGDVLPRLYGRIRAAGQLIWALPIAGAGGKGGGRQSAGSSFAIALSSGPILDIGRIWADGREIRNAAGEFEFQTEMRLHRAGLNQSVDPLIAAAEGEDGALAYGRLAYVLFENFDLASFGNRIPNFSFEVIADAGAPSDWLRDQATRAEIPVWDIEGDRSAGGYAALGRVLDDCGRLSRLGDCSLRFADGRARFGGPPGMFPIGKGELLAADGRPAELVQGNRPAVMGVTYMDADRDYQPGRQRVARSRRGPELESEAPVAATAGMALALAARFLRQTEAAADRIRFGLSWRRLGISVGDFVDLEGLGLWRIVERDIRGLMIFLVAERVAAEEHWPVGDSDPGRSLPSPMMPSAPTDVHLFETPVPLTAGRPAAWLWMGGGSGWRGASAVLLEGGDQTAIGEIRQPMSWGRLLETVEPGPESLWDRCNALLVETEVGVPPFESRSESDVLAGANLVRVGEEVLQFCEAEPLTRNIVRLSGLLRGQFGTGFRMRALQPGEIVRLISPGRLLRVELPADSSGRNLLVLATGRGDPVGGTETTLDVEGMTGAPMAPVHLRVRRMADGRISSSWLPRSAADWGWSSGNSRHAAWVWHFRTTGGRAVSKPVGALALELSVAEQVALLGEPFGAGVVTIEAVGDGPADLRTSHPASV